MKKSMRAYYHYCRLGFKIGNCVNNQIISGWKQRSPIELIDSIHQGSFRIESSTHIFISYLCLIIIEHNLY